MRALLVDWLIDLHCKFKLSNQTLHIAINLLDRVLSAKPVTRQNLQLLGVTTTFIASKYEEVY
jgi:hypothetical protein